MTKTHFGFETVNEETKAQRVAGVFSSVATKYDIMNDLMSVACTAYGKNSLLTSPHRARANVCWMSQAARQIFL